MCKKKNKYKGKLLKDVEIWKQIMDCKVINSQSAERKAIQHLILHSLSFIHFHYSNGSSRAHDGVVIQWKDLEMGLIVV